MAMSVYYAVLLFLQISFVHSSVNMALNKPAEQSTRPYKNIGFASLVTDGCLLQDITCGKKSGITRPANCPGTNCCAHQEEFQKFVWLRVDLEREVEIKSVTVYYRTDYGQSAERFKGYKLYTSAKRNYTATDLCFEHLESNNPESIVSHDCHSLSRYVTVTNTLDHKKGNIYRAQALLEICELQVFGCPVGFYGNNTCNKRCPNTCLDGRCDPDTGVCFGNKTQTMAMKSTDTGSNLSNTTGSKVIGGVGCLIGLVALLFGIVLYTKFNRFVKNAERAGISFQKYHKEDSYNQLVSFEQ